MIRHDSQNGWQWVRLGDITSVESGSGFPTEYQGATYGQYPFYKVSDMNLPGNEIFMRFHNNAIEEQVRTGLKAKAHPIGTVIFPKIGAAIATNKKRILTQESCFDNNVIGIYPSTKLDSVFLYHMMLMKDLSDFANTGNPPSIRKTTLEDWTIPLPPLTEQKRIAGILDAADALRAKRRAALAELDALLQSTFLDMFGDPVTNPMGWEVQPFAKLANNEDGSRIPVKKADREKMDGEFPYYGASGIIDYVDQYLFEGERLLIGEDGANLIARSTPVAFLAKGKFWVNNHAHVLAFNGEAELLFLEAFVNKIDLKPYVTGTAQPKLNQNKLNQIPVPLPPLEIQRRFIKIVESVEHQKARMRAHLSELDTLFASLQSRAFNGEL